MTQITGTLAKVPAYLVLSPRYLHWTSAQSPVSPGHRKPVRSLPAQLHLRCPLARGRQTVSIVCALPHHCHQHCPAYTHMGTWLVKLLGTQGQRQPWASVLALMLGSRTKCWPFFCHPRAFSALWSVTMGGDIFFVVTCFCVG